MYTTEVRALRACASEKQVALIKCNKAGKLFARCSLLLIFKQCSSLPAIIQLLLLLPVTLYIVIAILKPASCSVISFCFIFLSELLSLFNSCYSSSLNSYVV